MKLQKLLEGITVLESNAPLDMEIIGVSYSSRSTKPGELFVAVPGYETDGHKYIPDAIAHGAGIVLCEREMPQEVPWVRVASSREALAQLGANWYGHPAEAVTMIGVTGTNGKTSSTYLLKSVLETALGAKVGLIGTICNMIGQEAWEAERTTPESFELQGLLAKMRDAGCTHVVMEVSSHALVLHRVGEIRYDVGAFTNLTKDHLDFHKTMEAYGDAKAMLFRACDKGVFNLDDPSAPKMIDGATCSIYTVGVAPAAELHAENIELGSDHIAMDVCEADTSVHLHLGIPGRFTVSNSLTVLGIARQLGISLPDAVSALSKATGVKGRIEVVPTPGTDYTVLIDYAHTPDGLENVLRSVRDFCKGRLISVFGCGGDRDRTKRPIMGGIAAENADFVIVTSDNPRTEDPEEIISEIVSGIKGRKNQYKVICDRPDAIRWAIDNHMPNDVILLAGKGHEDYQVVGHEKHHMDEREIVAEHIEKRKNR